MSSTWHYRNGIMPSDWCMNSSRVLPSQREPATKGKSPVQKKAKRKVKQMVLEADGTGLDGSAPGTQSGSAAGTTNTTSETQSGSAAGTTNTTSETDGGTQTDGGTLSGSDGGTPSVSAAGTTNTTNETSGGVTEKTAEGLFEAMKEGTEADKEAVNSFVESGFLFLEREHPEMDPAKKYAYRFLLDNAAKYVPGTTMNKSNPTPMNNSTPDGQCRGPAPVTDQKKNTSDDESDQGNELQDDESNETPMKPNTLFATPKFRVHVVMELSGRKFQLKGNFPVCKYLTSGGTTGVDIKVGINVAAVVFEMAKILVVGNGHQGPHPFMKELHNNWDTDWMKLFKRELEKMLSDGSNLKLVVRKEMVTNPKEADVEIELDRQNIAHPGTALKLRFLITLNWKEASVEEADKSTFTSMCDDMEENVKKAILTRRKMDVVEME